MTKSNNYPGSKFGNGVYHNIINKIPPHQVYIELFGGDAAIAKNKKPAELTNIIFEINPNTIAKNNYPSAFTVYNSCGYQAVKNNFGGSLPSSVFIYADPPYQIDARRAGQLYYGQYEWTNKQHIEFAEVIKQSKYLVAVSAYRSSLYDRLYKDWYLHEFNAMTRKGLVKEALYMNYAPPTELHEYTFLGDNKQERQMLKRKIASMVNKLKALPVLERNAILHNIKSWYEFI